MWGGFDDDENAFDLRAAGGLYGLAAGAQHLQNRQFDEYYRCYDLSMLPGNERPNLIYGGKAILPPSALDRLSRLNITYPMLFELSDSRTNTISHCGVLEFIAEEGRIYTPRWMMRRLGIGIGDLLRVKSTDLPQGTFVKMQPQDQAFLDISDPKAVLENALRNFSTLTKDDIFAILYNDQVYEIQVLEVRPESESRAVSVIETDLEVDFAPPVGYVEPKAGSQSAHLGASAPIQGGMAALLKYNITPETVAQGQTLSGKPLDLSDTLQPTAATTHGTGTKTRSPAPLRVPFGTLFFGYNLIEKKPTNAVEDNELLNFKGEGKTLKQKKKRSPPSTST